MTSPFDRLGISPDASASEIKAAYHAKLREFPAHTHPEEFKAIRTAYDAIRTGEATKTNDDFLQVRPIEATLDPEVLQQMRDRATALITLSLEDLIQETF